MRNRVHDHDCLICGPYECRDRRCRICQQIGPDKHRRIPDVPYEGGWAHDACLVAELLSEEMHNEAEGWEPPPTPRFPVGA